MSCWLRRPGRTHPPLLRSIRCSNLVYQVYQPAEITGERESEIAERVSEIAGGRQSVPIAAKFCAAGGGRPERSRLPRRLLLHGRKSCAAEVYFSFFLLGLSASSRLRFPNASLGASLSSLPSPFTPSPFVNIRLQDEGLRCLTRKHARHQGAA